jgi:predicted dehydrogenase
MLRNSLPGPLPVALFGAGGYGAVHLDLLLGFQKQGLVRLLAVAEPAVSRLPDLRAVLQQKQIPCYEKAEELFQQEPELRAVCIAAPIPWHESLCRLALERNFHIYLEKPPVPLIQQWNSLVQLDSTRKIAVAFQNIASRPIQVLKQWCVEGRLGRIKTIRMAGGWPRDHAYYERNNWAGKLLAGNVPVFDGPATNGLAHVLHDAMFLASPEPLSFSTPVEVTAEIYRARPLEGYDTCCFRAVLENEIELTAALTHACDKKFPYQIVVTGTKARAWIERDGSALRNDQGWPEVEEPEYLTARSRCYEDFLLYAREELSRPHTFLSDTRGYVLLTNGMILSSGGIHAIPPSSVSLTGAGSESTYAVEDILPMLESTLKTGRLFSEQNVGWAVKGEKISVRELKSLSLESFLGSP